MQEVSRPVIGQGQRAHRRSAGRWLRRLLGGLLLAGGLARAMAQDAVQIEFDAALRDFEVGQWDRAVAGFSNVVARFPDAPLRSDALEREQFARAEAAFARGDFAAASEGFAAYQKAHADRPRAALAAVREAASRLRLGDRPGALAVLEAPGGPFLARLQAGTEPSVVLSGLLLKAEALRAEQRLADAEAVLVQAAPLAGTPAAQWARLQALGEVQEAAGRLEAAAGTAEALGEALADGGSPERRAETSARAGRLWLRAGNRERADAAFARNLASTVPLPLQREAVLHLADSSMGRGDFGAARERLQAFLTANPRLADAAGFQLRLGQSLLRQFVAAGGVTNAAPENAALLVQAAAALDAGLAESGTGETAAMLHLGRGWVAWHEANAPGAGAAVVSDRLRAAAAHFAAAASGLRPGLPQATARFKQADALLRLQEPAAALTNYLSVATDHPADAEVQTELVERALQQAVLSAVEARDTGAATRAVDLLLARQPGASAAGDSSLQVAVALSRSGNTTNARAVLQRFLKAYPESTQAADAELELASLDLRAEAWTNAVASLDLWVQRHTNHPSLVRAEFDRAYAAVRAGTITNAIGHFAQLAARHPTNAIAETASLWLAGHYFSQGDFARSGAACVSIVTNAAWKGGPGWYLARFWAAEAARRLQNLGSAEEQLVALIEDRSTPPHLVPAAFFALGEVRLEQAPAAGQPPLQNFQLALEAFTKAAQYTNAPQAAAALGKMADCHLQLATKATNSYLKADELYAGVLGSPGADISARSKAAFGRAVIAEKLAGAAEDAPARALRLEALERYLEIGNGSILRPGEVSDPWWVKEAGREAGRLLEDLGRWADAAALYDRLAVELPALRATWESRAAAARRRLAEGGP